MIAIIILFATIANAFQWKQSVVSRKSSVMMADIVDTAVGAGQFKTLAAALTAANLIPALKGPGPFTVFAPTDEAFAKLPPGTVESLLKDIPALTKILTNHVVSGSLNTNSLLREGYQDLTTINNGKLKITTKINLKIENAKFIDKDIICSNGIIHIIDSVLVPKPTVAPFDPKNEAGVSGPFGFFDPLGLCPQTKADFSKFRESELKHGRIAMIAVLGIFVAEKHMVFFGNFITGPAINQYQQAESLFNAWSFNVVGFILAVEGYNIVNGWQSPSEATGLATLKEDYINGDLKFDPLGLKPTNAKDFKAIQTKELNNGRLAMIAAAGIVVQELITQSRVFK